MSNLSTETAHRLKSASFPQPAPEVGQWWYLGKHLQFIQTRHIEPGGIMAGDFCIFTPWSHVTKSLSAVQVLEHCAYCPTDAELLAALGNKYRVEMSGTDFGVWRKTAIPFIRSGVTAPVMSEALAAVWLQSKEK